MSTFPGVLTPNADGGVPEVDALVIRQQQRQLIDVVTGDVANYSAECCLGCDYCE